MWINGVASCNSNPWMNLASNADTMSGNVSISTGVANEPDMAQGIVDLTTSSLGGSTNMGFASTSSCASVISSSAAPAFQINSSIALGTVSNEFWFPLHTNSSNGNGHWGTGRDLSNYDFLSTPASVVIQ